MDADWLIVEHDAVAGIIRDLAKERSFYGSAANLLAAMVEYQVQAETGFKRRLPQTPRALSSHLRRIAPNLQRIGIEVEFEPRRNRIRPIRISRSDTVACYAEAEVSDDGDGGDGGDGNAEQLQEQTVSTTDSVTRQD